MPAQSLTNVDCRANYRVAQEEKEAGEEDPEPGREGGGGGGGGGTIDHRGHGQGGGENPVKPVEIIIQNVSSAHVRTANMPEEEAWIRIDMRNRVPTHCFWPPVNLQRKVYLISNDRKRGGGSERRAVERGDKSTGYQTG